MTLDSVIALLEHGDTDTVRATLIGLTEGDRKALGPKARGWITRGNPTRVSSTDAALAVLATAGGQRQATIAADAFDLDDSFVDSAVAILQARGPSWLPEFVDALLEHEGSWNWRLARGLVRAGAVPAPDHPEYYRGTVRGIPDYLAKARRPLVEQLDADPDLAGDHLLRMLSTEGVGRLLAFHDTYQESTYDYLPNHTSFAPGTWRVTLLVLSQQGRLDRGRLLDAVLAAPLRDWAGVDLGWYVSLHDALEPTLDEVLARQSTYARLLTVEHGPSVKTAQRAILRMLRDPRFDPAPVVGASAATLGRSDKATVAAHLRLLDKLRAADPDIQIADAVRVAANHPRADIREHAAKLLARLGEAPTTYEATLFSAPAPEPWPTPGSVDPVSTPEELSDVLLGLMEEIDAIEMERAIDGLLRFSDERPRTTDLLLSRADATQHYAEDPRIAPAVLARAWLAPRARRCDDDWPILLGHTVYPTRAALPETFVGALGRRLTGIAHAIRRGRHTSVALPSSTDHSVDPDELSRRFRDAGRAHPVLELELAIALLRVTPDERPSVAIPRSFRRSAVVSRVLETGSPNWEREVVTYQRGAWKPESRVPIFRSELAPQGAADGILGRATPERTLDDEVQYGEYEPRFEQTLALGASLLPHDPDVLAAHAHPYLSRDLRKDRACSVPVLEALARSRERNGGPASSALALGLAAQDGRARTAAQDALIDRSRHGVLDGTQLGTQAALLLRDDLVVGTRISTGLSEVARASDSAVGPLLDALQELMGVLPGRRDAATFVEVAADLHERTSRKLKLPPEFHKLAAGKGSSMLAKSARRLL